MPQGERGIVAIIGFMGAGKSTVGRMLAGRLGMDFVDLDEVIEAAAEMSVEGIFHAEGEEGFRGREAEALKGELETGGKVLACGGGVVNREENVRLLTEACSVFYLRISAETAIRRLGGTTGRPLLQGVDMAWDVRELMDEREGRYVRAAHEVIEADDMTPEQVVEEIIARWPG